MSNLYNILDNMIRPKTDDLGYALEARNIAKDKMIRINNGSFYVAEKSMSEAALIFSFCETPTATMELFRDLKKLNTKLEVRRLRSYYMPRLVKETLPGIMIATNLNAQFAAQRRQMRDYNIAVMYNQPTLVKNDSCVVDMAWITSIIKNKTILNNRKLNKQARAGVLNIFKRYIAHTFTNAYKNKILYFRSPLTEPSIRMVMFEGNMNKILNPALLFIEWMQNDKDGFKNWLKEHNVSMIFEGRDGRCMVLSGKDNFTKLPQFNSKYIMKMLHVLDNDKDFKTDDLDKELLEDGMSASDIKVKSDDGIITDELTLQDVKEDTITDAEIDDLFAYKHTDGTIDEDSEDMHKIVSIDDIKAEDPQVIDNVDEDLEASKALSEDELLDVDEIVSDLDEITTSDLLLQKRPETKDYFHIIEDKNIPAEEKAIKIQEEHNYTKLKTAVENTPEVKALKTRMLKSYGKPVGEIVKNIKKHSIKDNSLNIETTNTSYHKSSVYSYDKNYKKYIGDDDLENIISSPVNLTYPVVLKEYNKKDISDREFKGYELNIKYETHTGETLEFKYDVPETISNDGNLFMGSTPKKLMLQNAPKPVIKQDDTVVVTTAYNKVICELTGKYASMKDKLYIQSFYAFAREAKNKHIFKVKTTPELGDFIYNNEMSYHMIHLNRHFVGMIDANFDIDFRGRGKDKDGLTILGTYYGSDVLHDPEKDIIKLGDKVFNSYEAIIFILQNEEPELWKKSLLTRTTDSQIMTPIGTIMGKKIPIVLLCLIATPLSSLLERLKKENDLEYKVVKNEDLPTTFKSNERFGVIRLATHSIIMRYNNDVNELLLTYLTTLDLEEYEVFDITQIMKEITGNWNTAIYIENFIDLFIDPTTKRVCELYGIPDDFVGMFIYAVSLFTSYMTMYKSDIRNYRLISQSEIINRCIYDVISKELSKNAARVKRGSRPRVESNKNDVIARLQALNTMAEANPISGFREIMEQSQVSFKGHMGINEDRAYNATVRMFNQNNFGSETCATPYGANAGITKHLPFDPTVANLSGEYEHHDSSVGLEAAQLTAFSDAYVPYTRFNHCARRLMQSGQFSHILPSDKSDPMLVSCHADEAAIKLTPKHSFIAEQDGYVKEINPSFIVIEYKDGTTDAISLVNVERNPDKGYYLKNDFTYDEKTIRAGKKFKVGDVIAYSKDSYKRKSNGKLGLAAGALVWVLTSDGESQWEDSTLPFQSLSEKLATKVVKRIARTIDLNTEMRDWNINIGSQVTPTDILFKYKMLTEDAAINDLFINADELTLKEVEAKYRGTIVDIRVYYRLGQDVTISPSIKRFIKEVDDVQRVKNHMASIDMIKDPFKRANLDKRPQILTKSGSSKINGDNIENGQMLIEYSIEILDKLGPGDKVVLDNALKGEPTMVLPNEARPIGAESGKKVDLCYSTYSIVKRMTPGLIMHGKLISILLHMAVKNRQILGIAPEPDSILDFNSSKKIRDGYYRRIPNEYL